MDALTQNALASLTGNLPKAILCVRKMTTEEANSADSFSDTISKAAALQKNLLQRTQRALNTSVTFDQLSSDGVLDESGFLALEVQYNPSMIRLETQAGRQVQYIGGNLGDQSTNQIVQVIQPVTTTMSFQLIFDDMNPNDAFMLENIAPTVGNAVSAFGSAKKKKKDGYSVQAQIDGLMALLTRNETRQVIFFWANLCFRGELTGVTSRYTMFNRIGNPVRGVVDLTLRQGSEGNFGYDESYWDKAFTKAFGAEAENKVSGMKDRFSKATNNNLLNLNL